MPAKGVNASDVFVALGNLKAHGCTKCGSAPLGGGNDPERMGFVTSNYVHNGVCEGWCGGDGERGG